MRARRPHSRLNSVVFPVFGLPSKATRRGEAIAASVEESVDAGDEDPFVWEPPEEVDVPAGGRRHDSPRRTADAESRRVNLEDAGRTHLTDLDLDAVFHAHGLEHRSVLVFEGLDIDHHPATAGAVESARGGSVGEGAGHGASGEGTDSPRS